MLETSATRRSTRRATEGHTGTRTSLHSAPPSGCLPEPQIAVRLSTDHTAGPAKPQSIPGSQRTASRPPTQTCPGSTRQPQCSPQPIAQTSWRYHASSRAGFRSIQRAHPEARYRHLADRQPLDLQPHRRDPAVRHSGRMETHRQHGNAGSQSAPSRMGFGSLPGEAHRSPGRLPRHEQRQDLQPGTQGQTRHTAREPTKHSPNSATAAGRTPSSPATYRTTP